MRAALVKAHKNKLRHLQAPKPLTLRSIKKNISNPKERFSEQNHVAFFWRQDCACITFTVLPPLQQGGIFFNTAMSRSSFPNFSSQTRV